MADVATTNSLWQMAQPQHILGWWLVQECLYHGSWVGGNSDLMESKFSSKWHTELRHTSVHSIIATEQMSISVTKPRMRHKWWTSLDAKRNTIARQLKYLNLDWMFGWYNNMAGREMFTLRGKHLAFWRVPWPMDNWWRSLRHQTPCYRKTKHSACVSRMYCRCNTSGYGHTCWGLSPNYPGRRTCRHLP